MRSSRHPSSVPHPDAREPARSGVRRTPLALLRPRPEGETEPVEASAAERQSWTDICRRDDLRGRWVALDDCEYEQPGDRPTEAVVVDADADVAELCARLRASRWKRCAIHFCGDAG